MALSAAIDNNHVYFNTLNLELSLDHVTYIRIDKREIKI